VFSKRIRRFIEEREREPERGREKRRNEGRVGN
jgi:hypothetical protein